MRSLKKQVHTYHFTGVQASRVIMAYRTVASDDYSWSLNACEIVVDASQSNDLNVLRNILTKIQVYIPYLFTHKAHSVIRRTLKFRLWHVSKMKIPPKYPVIRRTQNYEKFCWPRSLYLQQFTSKSYDNFFGLSLDKTDHVIQTGR